MNLNSNEDQADDNYFRVNDSEVKVAPEEAETVQLIKGNPELRVPVQRRVQRT